MTGRAVLAAALGTAAAGGLLAVSVVGVSWLLLAGVAAALAGLGLLGWRAAADDRAADGWWARISRDRRGIVLALLSFTVVFVAVRGLTYAIRASEDGALIGGVIGDVEAGGVHLHHYLWGILLLAAVGFAALLDPGPRVRLGLGIAYGGGLALVVDEFSLLLELEDVYWQEAGRWSVDLGVTLAAAAGTALVVTRERRRSAR